MIKIRFNCAKLLVIEEHYFNSNFIFSIFTSMKKYIYKTNWNTRRLQTRLWNFNAKLPILREFSVPKIDTNWRNHVRQFFDVLKSAVWKSHFWCLRSFSRCFRSYEWFQPQPFIQLMSDWWYLIMKIQIHHTKVKFPFGEIKCVLLSVLHN